MITSMKFLVASGTVTKGSICEPKWHWDANLDMKPREMTAYGNTGRKN